QKVSVFVSSSAVLNAPQKIIPATKPASTRKPRLKIELGRRSTSQSLRAKVSARCQKEGCGASVVVIVAPQGPPASAGCRYRQNHSRSEPVHCVGEHGIACRNTGAARSTPEIVRRDQRSE